MIKNRKKKEVRGRRRTAGAVSALLCSLLLAQALTGCTLKEETAAMQPDSMEGNGSYEVPATHPNVLVDQTGYETGRDKTVLFRGEHLASNFEVIEVNSGAVVYTGNITGGNDSDGNSVSYGNFTDLKKPGSYYIQTEIIGRSYPFKIEDDIYSGLLAALLGSLQESRSKEGLHTYDTMEGCSIIKNLLLAYEFYPEEFTDDLGIPDSGNMVPDVLDILRYEAENLIIKQDSKSGGIYSGLQHEEEITSEATAEFSAAMAQLYAIYAAYDTTFASDCLSAAKKAWKYLEPSLNQDSPYIYMAAAQLYKVTGENAYHNYIKNYHKIKKDDIVPEAELYGDIAYLDTKYAVDVTVCRSLMKELMEKAEEIARVTQESVYFVSGKDNEETLSNILCLSIVNHVITNYEYGTVLLDNLHYFLGRNEECTSYIKGFGQTDPDNISMRSEITKDPALTSVLIFMLSEIINSDTGMEELS